MILSLKQDSERKMCFSGTKYPQSPLILQKSVTKEWKKEIPELKEVNKMSDIVFCWPFILIWCVYYIKYPHPTLHTIIYGLAGKDKKKSQFVSEQLAWLVQFLPCCSPNPTSAVFHSINYSHGYLLSINVCGCVCVFVFENSLCRQFQIASKAMVQLKKLFPCCWWLFLKTSSVSLGYWDWCSVYFFLFKP